MIIYLISAIIIYIFVLGKVEKKIQRHNQDDLLNNIDKHFEEKRKNKEE